MPGIFSRTCWTASCVDDGWVARPSSVDLLEEFMDVNFKQTKCGDVTPFRKDIFNGIGLIGRESMPS